MYRAAACGYHYITVINRVESPNFKRYQQTGVSAVHRINVFFCIYIRYIILPGGYDVADNNFYFQRQPVAKYIADRYFSVPFLTARANQRVSAESVNRYPVGIAAPLKIALAALVFADYVDKNIIINPAGLNNNSRFIRSHIHRFFYICKSACYCFVNLKYDLHVVFTLAVKQL